MGVWVGWVYGWVAGCVCVCVWVCVFFIFILTTVSVLTAAAMCACRGSRSIGTNPRCPKIIRMRMDLDREDVLCVPAQGGCGTLNCTAPACCALGQEG